MPPRNEQADQQGDGQQQQKGIAGLLDSMALVPTQQSRKKAKNRYAFWESQPVMQFNEQAEDSEDGPIDAPKTVDEVRKEPISLPSSFLWCECNINDPQEVQEVYTLLHNNYVEDDDAMFRFNYSPAFLQWALQPPGYERDWHVGVRVQGSNKLVAFISAIPASIRANNKLVPAVEINFLCVLKKLRSKRLAPVLIKEITRRVNLRNIWQASYTAGVVLPRPVCACRYWHRSLNPKKLIEVGFSSLAVGGLRHCSGWVGVSWQCYDKESSDGSTREASASGCSRRGSAVLQLLGVL
eukprot:GHRQ01012711.1.p1 GENE.GHRQ01012711.1~~GHRQ01012711.1.p1  ORF type:complete len:296 (+),score=106.08 GHRQ01012711.1:156-1043(+)